MVLYCFADGIDLDFEHFSIKTNGNDSKEDRSDDQIKEQIANFATFVYYLRIELDNNIKVWKQTIKDCNEWLVNELKIISPKLIVFLGRHSMLRFFPTEKISDIHGKLLLKMIPELGKKQAFLPLYHPAAALYNGGMRQTLIRDFNKIPKALEKINTK